ncbi:MAG: hypothetical protein HY973_03050 [Candidatus Kerfeldbacteria bacterium]|nr:hypothetical protein [Candidatus Kerfeldbacteria bacterium]
MAKGRRRFKYTSDGQPLMYISHQQHDNLIKRVIKRLVKSNYKPDLIIFIATGGLYVGSVLKRVLNAACAIWQAQGYENKSGSKYDVASRKIVFSKHLVFISPDGKQLELTKKTFAKFQNILLVDDLDDTGRTLHKGLRLLRKHFGDKFQIRTLCLWHKTCSTFMVDYIAEAVELDPKSGKYPWIVQPYEDLADRIGRFLRRKKKK